ncbi:MAG: hypothetical protein ACMUEM_01510 [Flavobacteriales bacterium AspAUS03]
MADEGLTIVIKVNGTYIYDLQFNPKSIGTEYGLRIIEDFIYLTDKKVLYCHIQALLSSIFTLIYLPWLTPEILFFFKLYRKAP